MRRVLVLGGNFDQIPFILELKRRGFWVALTDINAQAAGRKYADTFRQIGYEDISQLLTFASEIDLSDRDCVFTAAAQFAQVGAANVAENFGIGYPPVSTIELCLNKLNFYENFKRCGIPIPETRVIKSKNELESLESNLGSQDNYYLKSDYSKNPKYIYRFSGSSCRPSEYFWGSDRHLRSAYVLQKEFLGRHLRLNMMPGKSIIYDFFSGDFLSEVETRTILEKYSINEKLRNFLTEHELSSWLVKFDLIVNDFSWCALDIGLDPPSRMARDLESSGYRFAKHYIDHYIYSDITYPDIGW